MRASEETLKALSPGILDCMTRYDINSPLRQAHFLAQIGHESGEGFYYGRKRWWGYKILCW
jgi:putative chitinase